MLALTLALMLSATTATTAVHPPITSRAELKAYLQKTPTNASPLASFSPGGRKRFLAQLVFTPRGVGTFSPGALENELTHPQIVKILALFGLQSFDDVIQGLAPAEQAQRRQERHAAARKRGCDSVSTCPESDIERHYDKLVLQNPKASLPDTQRAAWEAKRYDQLIAQYQTSTSLASVDRPDLRLLKRAAEHVTLWVPSATYIRQLQNDLAEMQRRGMTDDGDYIGLYKALIANHQFDQARALAQQYPSMDIVPLPTWKPPTKLAAGQPTALSLASDGQTMTRQAFDLSTPLRIVVVASCHFSKDAARAIKADPKLRALFVNHAIWLADQSESIAAAKDWNQAFPKQPIHIAWRDSEWPKLDSWAMPTFYVFHHGKLVDQWAGWPADSGMTMLRHHLQKDGILQPK